MKSKISPLHLYSDNALRLAKADLEGGGGGGGARGFRCLDVCLLGAQIKDLMKSCFLSLQERAEKKALKIYILHLIKDKKGKNRDEDECQFLQMKVKHYSLNMSILFPSVYKKKEI